MNVEHCGMSVSKQYIALTYAPITVMPHPPRLVVSRDYEGDLTSAACPLGGAFALYGELLLYIRTFV